MNQASYTQKALQKGGLGSCFLNLASVVILLGQFLVFEVVKDKSRRTLPRLQANSQVFTYC